VCAAALPGWPPTLRCASCGRTIPTDDGILLFTDEPDLNLDGARAYIGYESVADGYAFRRHPPGLQERMSLAYGAAIAAIVGPHSILLDVGCGPAGYDVEAAKRGLRVVAGDISLNMLKILSARLHEAPAASLIPCRLNAYALPLLGQSVDAAAALELLHFVGGPEHVLGEVKRVLKPGSRFITNGPSDHEAPDDDLNAKVNLYYREALIQRGVQLSRPPGWTSAQIRDNLPKFFPNCRTVETESLVFRFCATPQWFLSRLASRYTMFQIGIDQAAHEEALREVRRRMVEQYGPNFEQIEQQYCFTERLVVCTE
jgi:ubiquinone/menaquinone biosynthesis C-methylase UbiE